MKLLMVLVCVLTQDETAKPGPDMDEIRRRVKDPEQVWTVFQELVAAGEYGTARNLLSPAAAKRISPEAFYLAFASFEPPRRMVASLEKHVVDVAGLRLRLCSREFGISRDFRIVKFMTIYALDFSSDDIEFLKGRPMAWYRLQVKRADGWHYAYPPDWTYAPLARSCVCGK
jgi:hypothetical protein